MIDSVVAEIDNRLRSLKAHGFSGALLVVENGKHRLDAAYGQIRGTRICATSKFWIASIAKQFTSAAVLKCEEQGLLQLSDRISKYLGQVPNEKQQITVQHLLVHQSGLRESGVAENVVDRAEALARILTQPLACRPGTLFGYSDANYQVAAAIVETAASQKFEEFVSRELLSLAGLSRTGFAATAQAGDVVPVLADLPPRLRIREWGEIGAGGMFSTTGDLFAWYQALRTGKVLTPKSVGKIFSSYGKMLEGWSGLGWFVSVSTAGNRVLFTRGCDPIGANGLIYVYPAKHLIVVVLSHADRTSDGTLWSLAVLRIIETILAF